MFDYSNIGEKIKTLAKVLFLLSAIGCVVSGITILFYSEFKSWISSLLCIVLGPLVSWLATLVLYGFGELICKTTEIAINTRTTAYASQGSTLKFCCPVCGKETDAFSANCKNCGAVVRENPLDPNYTERVNARKELEERAKSEQTLRETSKKNAMPIHLNRFGDGTCPSCKKPVSFESNIGHFTCPHCKTVLNAQK